MDLSILLVPVVFLGVALLLSKAGGSNKSTSTSASPAWRAEYSKNVSIEKDGSFNFPLQDGVHYVTKDWVPLDENIGIRMRYRIEGGEIIGANCKDPAPSAVTLYLQRKGDNMSGEGKYETYRWWAVDSTGPVSQGEHEIVAYFDARWNAVMTSNSLDHNKEFREAIYNTGKIGYTFANCTGYGHGAYSTGPARFTLLEYEVI